MYYFYNFDHVEKKFLGHTDTLTQRVARSFTPQRLLRQIPGLGEILGFVEKNLFYRTLSLDFYSNPN